MGVSEKLELLGKGVYGKDIPGEITIKSIPTASELDYVGAEDFEKTMLEKIFPEAIEEQFDYRQLLEIDFHWICRALRFLNYGPYYTTNVIFCQNCGTIHGEYQVDLRTTECVPFPENFVNSIVISKDEFIDFKQDIVLHLPTIQEMLNARNDKFFQNSNGEPNLRLARKCYMVSAVGSNKSVTPVEAKRIIKNELSPADYIIFNGVSDELINYGLRYGGYTRCPKCNGEEATYAALVSDKFFRPTLGNLRSWRDDRSSRGNKEGA